MSTDQFIKFCKGNVSMQTEMVFDKYVPDDEIYLVWFSKTLQNKKALLASPLDEDNFYYEFTFDGYKKKIYIDKYKKFRNQVLDNVDFMNNATKF